MALINSELTVFVITVSILYVVFAFRQRRDFGLGFKSQAATSLTGKLYHKLGRYNDPALENYVVSNAKFTSRTRNMG